MEDELFDENATFKATPKGLASLALSQANICDFNDPRIEPFWILFEHYMKESGYIVED